MNTTLLNRKCIICDDFMDQTGVFSSHLICDKQVDNHSYAIKYYDDNLKIFLHRLRLSEPNPNNKLKRNSYEIIWDARGKPITNCNVYNVDKWQNIVTYDGWRDFNFADPQSIILKIKKLAAF